MLHISKNIHSSLLSWRDRYSNNLKYISQNGQNIWSGEMDNWLFETFKNLWCRIGVIFMQKNLILPWMKCVHTHHPRMNFYTGKVFWVVVPIAHVLVFQAKNQICIIACKTHTIQKENLLFVFTISGYCVNWKTMHQKRSCYDGYIYCWF